VWALVILSYKVPGFPVRNVLGAIARMAVAGALGGEAMWLVARHVGANTGPGALGRLIVAGVTGVAVYVAALAGQRAPELGPLRRRFGR